MITQRNIETEGDLYELLESMEWAYVMVTDADDRPWLIYQTEDEPWAVSFPVEGPEGFKPVTVPDVIVPVEALALPLIVRYDPGDGVGGSE